MQLIVLLCSIFYAFLPSSPLTPSALSAPQVSKEFRVRLSSSPQSFDWSSATSGSEGAVIQNLMEGLFRDDGKLVPVLAESYVWSNQEKTLTIKIRKKIKWTDGVQLKAQHFVDAFEHLLNPIANSANASLVFDIVGARDYFYGKARTFASVGVTAPKEYELVIKLNEPRVNFINVLTHWATYPFRIDQPSLTLGPYQMIKREGNEIFLKANARYHGKAPKLKSVTFEAISSGEEALKAFQAGRIDYLLQLEDELAEKNKSIVGLGFVDSFRVVALLHLNPSRVETNSPEKRRKIMSAISTQALIETHASTRVIAPSLIPSAHSMAISLAKSGAPLPDTALILGYPNDAFSKAVAEQLQNVSKALKLKIEPLPQNDAAAAKTYAKRYDLIFTLFGLDYSDPDQLFSSFLAQGSHDFFGVNTAELLSLIQKARSTPDDKERNRIYQSASEYLQNKLAIVMPLFYRRRAYLLNPHYRAEKIGQGSPLLSRITLQ